MARPSKLKENQWNDISRRLLDGEKAGDLAKEYKIARSTIAERFSDNHGNIKNVANQLIDADKNFNALTVSDKVSVIRLVDDLKAISSHLASAGKFNAMTAHRLSGVAQAQAELIDDADPLSEDSLNTLKGIGILTRIANESSVIGLTLVKANEARNRIGIDVTTDKELLNRLRRGRERASGTGEESPEKEFPDFV